jgi:hypothetical protein
LDITAQASVTPPLQHNLDQAAQKFDTSAVRATATSPPPPTLSQSPKAIAATDEQAEADGNDGNAYLTPITTTESFSPLPSPISASTPMSPREFKPGKNNLPLAFDGDEQSHLDDSKQ